MKPVHALIAVTLALATAFVACQTPGRLGASAPLGAPATIAFSAVIDGGNQISPSVNTNFQPFSAACLVSPTASSASGTLQIWVSDDGTNFGPAPAGLSSTTVTSTNVQGYFNDTSLAPAGVSASLNPNLFQFAELAIVATTDGGTIPFTCGANVVPVQFH